MRRYDAHFASATWGARCGKSARRVLRGGTDARGAASRSVSTHHRVNHDILIDRLGKRVNDAGIIRLVRAYLNAGIMANGVVSERTEGTPQGGPLSPLLANVMLDEVDRELEKRGHRFVRYADDCNVYVRSMRAGERVMSLLRRVYTRLHLQINESKSAVASAFGRKFLGYELWLKDGKKVMRAVSGKALETYRQKIRQLTRRMGGASVHEVVSRLRRYILGWKAYFILAQTPQVWRSLDEWMRHRMRAIHLKQWRRASTIYRAVIALGATPKQAKIAASKSGRWWHGSEKALNSVLTISYFDRLGMPRLT